MAAKLIAEEGIALGLTLVLEKGESWVIGRDPDSCDLVIADSLVSRRHARCWVEEGVYSIENLSATNPILINGKKCEEPQVLHEDDRIQIGETIFHFILEEAHAPTMPSFPPEEPPSIPGGEEPYDTLYESPYPEDVEQEEMVDLTPTGRWLLKVVAGPNTGAELALQSEQTYLIGTDPNVCDIVFQDLSVSRQHARLRVGADDSLQIEDLHSRNGVLIDERLIEEPSPLGANSLVTLGTTKLVIIDREEAQETLITAPPPPAVEEEVEEEMAREEEILMAPGGEAALMAKPRPIITGGTLILLLVFLGVIVIAITGAAALFKTQEVEMPHRDYNKEIAKALAPFPDVRFTFTPSTGKLFILGHLQTPVEKNELFYNLEDLPFITSIDDNVIIDQNIWEEYNAILSKKPEWRSVSLYSPAPGLFVLSGYIQKRSVAAALNDYLRLNFPFLERLQNEVIVEETLLDDVRATLISAGLTSVEPSYSEGELLLTGYIPRKEQQRFTQVLKELQGIRGVRQIRNLVVLVAEDQSVIDLTSRVKVGGSTTRDGVPVNVLVDGQILSEGDNFRGMQVVTIKPNVVILEKEGIKYKIDYTAQ